MNEIRMLLRTAARRLETSAFLSKGHLVLVALGALVALMLIIERLGAETRVPNHEWLQPKRGEW